MKLSDNKYFLVGLAFFIGVLFSYSMISLENSKNNSKDDSNKSISSKRIEKNIIRKPRTVRRDSIDDFAIRQQKIMKQMMKAFDQSLTLDMDLDINSKMGFDSNSLEVTEYSDSKYRYVKLKAEDIDKDSLKIKVSDGRIDISGEVRKEEQSGGAYGSSASTYVSSFSKSFNVPRMVKEETAYITVEKGEIVIRFEKA